MADELDSLLDQHKYAEYYEKAKELYKKNDTIENKVIYDKANRVYRAYKECLEFNKKKHKNHYEILGVPENANDELIRKNYKKLVLRFHPDKTSIKESNDVFLKIQTAYNALKDKKSRDEYDIQRKFGTQLSSQGNFNQSTNLEVIFNSHNDRGFHHFHNFQNIDDLIKYIVNDIEEIDARVSGRRGINVNQDIDLNRIRVVALLFVTLFFYFIIIGLFG